MYKKEGLLVCILLISIFSISLVAADDLDDCVNKCKVNLETEEERSPCIIECKELYGFEDGKGELKCLPCGEGCYPADQVAAMYCGPPENGEPDCGVVDGRCEVLGFGVII